MESNRERSQRPANIASQTNQQRPLLSPNSKVHQLETDNDIQRARDSRAQPKSEKPTRGSWSYWKSFVTVSATLVLGVALATGHHFLYLRFHGKVVGDISVSQSWILRFGTAFAFLVNTAFAISVGASYVQFQWFSLQRHSLRIEEIDSLTDILGNALRLFYNTVFLKQPILLFIALVAW